MVSGTRLLGDEAIGVVVERSVEGVSNLELGRDFFSIGGC